MNRSYLYVYGNGRIDKARLGAVTDVDNGTRGVYFFDAFESRRDSFIGSIDLQGSQALAIIVPLQEEIPLSTDIETEPSEQEISPESFEIYDDTAPAESVEPLSSAPIPAATTAGASQVISQTVITYTYDALNRLTAADYSDGSFFHYAYDAAGNRLGETTQAESNVYAYDDANRLASANGVAYAWDANGNLLSDGVNSYTYTNNKLSSITGNNLNITYQYNGLGERVSQTVNGVTTYITVDLNAGLSQVLSDGTNTYLYGVERIAQVSTSGEEYFLADALGSVRQLVDANGSVQTVKSYEPYGEILSSLGDGLSNYGFTGEWTDSHIELVNLRSRMYDPGTGRFLTRDTWQGDYTRPSSLNSWNYVEGNPVNLTDSSGHWAYPIPPAWEDALKTHRFLGEGLVLAAKALYSKVGLSRICAFSSEPEVTDTLDELVTDYVCEYGGDSQSFGYSSPLTQQLARIHSIYELRKKFYEAGGYLKPGGQGFGLSGFIWAKVDIVFSGNEPVHFFLNINTPLNISDYLGSYNYDISQTERDTIKFKITNLTSLESGTRLAPRKSIDDISLEEYWTNPTAYKDRHVISILSSKSQDETSGYEGGGTMKQIFRWEEPYDPLLKCWDWYPPYPVGLEFLKILPWRG